MNHIEVMKQALEALERADKISGYPNNKKPITALRQAIEQAELAQRAEEAFERSEQAEQQEPVADRDAFERYWKKTRGEKKSDRELKRHPLQPQTYIQDSANRHWVTWQAATRKASPPPRHPLTDEEIEDLYFDKFSMGELKAFARAIEAAHGIKENT
jgi:hypothetical protein